MTAAKPQWSTTHTIIAGGGTAPMVAIWIIERSHDDLSMAWYLTGAALISLLSALSLKNVHES